MSEAIEDVLNRCNGVRVEKTKNEQQYSRFGSSAAFTYKFFKVGEIVVQDDIFIELTGTSTKGTIAKIVDIEVDTYAERYPTLDSYANSTELVAWEVTFIYEVEGRKQKGRIKDRHVKVLVGEHQTKYVREVKTHVKVEVKNPVNKYKQEMKLGDWVIGTRTGKRLGIGRITRWTNHNVWAVRGDDINDKSKEFKFDSIKETFTMPDDEHVKLLTMAVLKGWQGE